MDRHGSILRMLGNGLFSLSGLSRLFSQTQLFVEPDKPDRPNELDRPVLSNSLAACLFPFQ